MNAHHVLCDKEVRVVVWRSEELVHLKIEDGISITFECELALLSVVAEDISVQLSHPDGFCQIRASFGTITLDYGLGPNRRNSCEVTREHFLAALA